MVGVRLLLGGQLLKLPTHLDEVGETLQREGLLRCWNRSSRATGMGGHPRWTPNSKDLYGVLT